MDTSASRTPTLSTPKATLKMRASLSICSHTGLPSKSSHPCTPQPMYQATAANPAPLTILAANPSRDDATTRYARRCRPVSRARGERIGRWQSGTLVGAIAAAASRLKKVATVTLILPRAALPLLPQSESVGVASDREGRTTEGTSSRVGSCGCRRAASGGRR